MIAYKINKLKSTKEDIVFEVVETNYDNPELVVVYIDSLGFVLGYDLNDYIEYGFKPAPNSLCYALPKDFPVVGLSYKPEPLLTPCNYYNFKNYPALNVVNQFCNKNKLSFKNCSSLKKLDKFLKGLTFGVEIETSATCGPEIEAYRNGFVFLKDGSIGGHELVSKILEGSDGLARIYRLCEAFKNSQINDLCSLHVHLGGPDIDINSDLFFIAFYMLYYDLQNEILELTLPYKVDHKFLKKKDKNHCERMPRLSLRDFKIYNNGKVDSDELNKASDLLFTFWNDGKSPSEDHNRKTRIHYKDGKNKWNIESRYYALNMFNYLFSNSGTIEFRLHHPTLNPYKIINWILICMAMVKYTKNNIQHIIEGKAKLHLNEVLDGFTTNFGKGYSKEGEFISSYLKEYTKERKKFFNHYLFTKTNVAKVEFAKDTIYKFEIDDGNSLFKF